MSNTKTITMNKKFTGESTGYKVIEVNVTYPSDNIYAVCTPVQNNK